MLQHSTFCGAFPGDGWSGGILAYVRFGCVPVIVLDGVDMPFERVGALSFAERHAGHGVGHGVGTVCARADRVRGDKH